MRGAPGPDDQRGWWLPGAGRKRERAGAGPM